MRKIRIGNDIAVQWSLVAKGTGEPFVVEGKDIRLSLKSIFATQEIEDFTAHGNTIAWTFKGAEQKQTGIYSLVVSVVDAQGAMVTTDVCQFVELVACSCEADGADEAGVHTESIDLVSNVEITSGTTNPSEVMLLIEDLQNNKIDKEADDYYPQLSVGTADNLAGVDEVDSEFSFRRSGGGAIADGVARVQSIKGNSVVWNQKLKERWSGSYAIESDCLRVIGGAYSSAYQHLSSQAPLNHKVLITGLVKGGKGALQLEGGEQTIYFESNSEWYNVAEIFTISISNSVTFQVYKFTEDDVYVKNTCLYDLTQMFGAGNEPTTIEEYNARKPIVEDEYAYNEGKVIHMTAEGISSKGVNAWDEEWDVGVIYSDGSNYDGISSCIRSKGFIRVVGGETYYYGNKQNNYTDYLNLFYYDKDKKFILRENKSIGTFNVPSNAAFLRFYVNDTYGTTYNHDICIGISGDWNGQYFPHLEASEDLSIVAKYFPNGMRSAGAAHDEIRYNKASNRWEKVVRVAEVDLGSLSYGKSGIGDNAFYTTSLQNKVKKEGRMMSAKFYLVDGITDTSKFLMSVDSVGTLYFNCPPITDVASFTNAMSGVMLYYELAEPIVTEIMEKDFNLDYSVWNCGTEQMVASKPSSALSADITYGFNAVGLIKQLRSMIEALSAKVANL